MSELMFLGGAILFIVGMTTGYLWAKMRQVSSVTGILILYMQSMEFKSLSQESQRIALDIVQNIHRLAESRG